MKVLIFYSTIEGQTRKIAEFISDLVEERGHEVFLADANQVGFVGAGSHDAAIMCAPVHIHHYPTPFVHFAHEWKDALNAMPSAFVSVSLAIASDDPDERAEAESIAAGLARQTGWNPTAVYNCAGALKYTQYDFFKRWVMRRIAAKEGGPVDTSQDYELTDWTALKAFVAEFMDAAARKIKAA